ncbi:hypothetical protein [Sphingorhabdus wooponensis]|uniref:Uncharacterized protein n=1 Tax=Sphingorhabdus wooponensis TaxID=940136 RepID=A0A3R8Q1C1_9SPHN|nr:hypothetical protein [Sphingorhabdus wooponensis]RRQ50962.1 hypothetical protein D7D48_10395 [Sphingorhabdus wooponensis]
MFKPFKGLFRGCIGFFIGGAKERRQMDGILKFLRSDLFLSLLGGFALGVAGLTLVKPVFANHKTVEVSHSITIGT